MSAGGFLAGKKALITGIASDRSIAWGIANAMHQQGAELALTYQNERLRPRVEKFAEQLGSNIVLPCDVASDEQIEQLREGIGARWASLDAIVHSIAFAPRDQLVGNYIDAINREGFLTAHEISSYSFSAMAKTFAPMLASTNGSLLTLSYIGSIRAMPSYNVMGVAKASLEASVRYCAQSLGPQGIRVNAISAGPIRTLAAAGIKGMKSMIDHYEKTAPLQRSVTIEEVGNVAAFLISDLASGMTGEVVYVDGGFNLVGLSESML